MSRTSVGLIFLLAGALVFMSLQKSCGEPVVKSDEVWQHRIDSILNQINGRDTLLISRDSVVYRTTKTREMITEYRNTTDTVLKLIRCDSIISECDTLAVQFARQDSVFREQISDYSEVVETQDSIIFDQSGQIKKLKRRNRVLIGIAAVLSVVAVLK